MQAAAPSRNELPAGPVHAKAPALAVTELVLGSRLAQGIGVAETW